MSSPYSERLANTSRSIADNLVAWWGIAGVLLLLGRAIWRLTPVALEPVYQGMSSGQVTVYAIWILFNAYAEGYRGFQKRFAPRVAARALQLRAFSPLVHRIAAPLFCLSLFHARLKTLIISWVTVVGITALVLAVRSIAQPWRGIIDGGVVVGLVWGAAATAVYFLRGLAGHPIPASPELPAAAMRAREETREML